MILETVAPAWKERHHTREADSSPFLGTFPVRIDFTGDPDKTIASAEKFLRGKKLAAPGNRMVIISDRAWAEL
jgi:hypothetical protein